MAASFFLQFHYYCRYLRIPNELILPRPTAGPLIRIPEDEKVFVMVFFGRIVCDAKVQHPSTSATTISWEKKSSDWWQFTALSTYHMTSLLIIQCSMIEILEIMEWIVPFNLILNLANHIARRSPCNIDIESVYKNFINIESKIKMSLNKY
jgi:hypothetical protein